MGSFESKVIAITGAASGMGLATAKLLASRGASLSLADVQAEALSAAVTAIKASSSPPAKIFSMSVDVRDPAQVNTWIHQTVEALGGLDGAANIAGVIGRTHGVLGVVDTDEDEWDFILAVNLTGVMHCMRAQLKVLRDGGSLVNAASVAGLMGRANNAAYAASKHGVIGLTRSAAKEVGRKGIRVNCFAPGYIETPMVAQARATRMAAGKGSTNGEMQVSALARAGQPEEVASLIAFLLGDESKFITGASYTIDGGWVC